ncbi:hypothetical protein J1792_31280 [Streptomyces triculaminicus]|uniref:Uncharacterized protein n=2 Tax=Streptomyces TaxID=1883 RepID=A0A939JRX8_9ACTN|nr:MULTISPECIES: hypothetical protein [Streptomyces]MBO0657058.1 hypothetical protein [Streptomyces triculaminicus]QSY49550.1 hypothetical protein J3S04_32490 [Streptomyces griseocarneus]
MIKVERHGAFNVNSVGLERLPFPLSFSVREADGSWMISAAAAQAGELIDVLTRTASDTVVVVNLATNSFLDEEYQQWRPSLIAAEQGVDCTVHPVGTWASDSIDLGEEFLVMHRDSLSRFLSSNWSPYELSLVDVPTGATPEQLDELALVIGTAAVDEPVLPRLDGSRFWFSGHDDCYLAVESTDPAIPSSVLGRLLALLAGSALTGDGGASSVRVPEPDGALSEQLIAESPHWIGVVGTASETTVTVELSAQSQRWHLGQQLPERADYRAMLDLAHGVWHLAPAES